MAKVVNPLMNGDQLLQINKAIFGYYRLFLFLLGCLQAGEPIKQAGILEGRIDGIKETCLLLSL
jgi:hypothetical protein